MRRLLSFAGDGEAVSGRLRLFRLPRATPVVLASSAAGTAYYAGLYYWRVDLCESTLQNVDDTLFREGSEGGARRGAAAHPDLPPGRKQDVREFRRALSAPPSHVTAVTSHSPGSASRFVAAALGGRAATARVRLPPAAAAAATGAATPTSSLPHISYAAAARAVATGLGIEFMCLRHQLADMLPLLAAGDDSGGDGGGGGGQQELLLALETATAALINIRAQDPKHHLPPIIVIEGLIGSGSINGGGDGGAAELLLSWCREVTTERQLAHVVLTAPEDWVVRLSGNGSGGGGNGGGGNGSGGSGGGGFLRRSTAKDVQIWTLKPPAHDDAEAFIRTRLLLHGGGGGSGGGGSGGSGGGGDSGADCEDKDTVSSAAALLVDVLHGPATDASGLLREAARLLARERWRNTAAERAEAALQDMSLAAWARTVAAIRLLASREISSSPGSGATTAGGNEVDWAEPCRNRNSGLPKAKRQDYRVVEEGTEVEKGEIRGGKGGRLPELLALMRLLGRDRAMPLSSALKLLGAGDSVAAIEDVAALTRLGILRLAPRGLCNNDDVTVLQRPVATSVTAVTGTFSGESAAAAASAAEATAAAAAAVDGVVGPLDPLWQPPPPPPLPQPASARAAAARAAVPPRANVTAAQNLASSSAAAAAAMSEDAAFAFQVSIANPLVAGAFLVLEHWPVFVGTSPSTAANGGGSGSSGGGGSGGSGSSGSGGSGGGLGDVARREAALREARRELLRRWALTRQQEERVSGLNADLASQSKVFASRRADRQPAANQRLKAALNAAEDELQYETLELSRRRAAARAAAAAAAATAAAAAAASAVSSSGGAVTVEDLAAAAAQEVTARIVQAGCGGAALKSARHSEAATRNAAAAVLAGVAAAGNGVLTAGDIQMVLCALGRFFSAEEVREGVATLACRRNGDVDAAALAAHFLGTDLQRRETQRLAGLRRRATANAAAADAGAAAATNSKAGSDGAAAEADSGDESEDITEKSDAEEEDSDEEEGTEGGAADPLQPDGESSGTATEDGEAAVTSPPPSN